MEENLFCDNNQDHNNYFNFRSVSGLTYIQHRLPNWIRNELKDSCKILDYGCGLGQNLIALRAENYMNVFGLDIDQHAIDNCQKQGLSVRKLDSKDIINPFHHRFDVVLMNHVLEHIPKNETIRTLSLIRRDFLADNGKLLISVPNAQANTGCYWAYEDWTHRTIFTSGSLLYVLRSAGFDSVEFLDIDCTAGSSNFKKFIRRFLLNLYRQNRLFWNKITCSAYHQPSPMIFSYEIKAKAS